MNKVMQFLCLSLAFVGKDGFCKAVAYVVALAVQRAVRHDQYGWLKGFVKRLIDLLVAVDGAIEDGKVDADELKVIVLAGKAMAKGDPSGYLAIGMVREDQTEDQAGE